MKYILVLYSVALATACNYIHPNVCKDMKSYGVLTKSKDCYFDPDVGSNTMLIIQREKYPVEAYTVTTKDGYIVTLYRIPSNGKPVFLQHGAVSSSEIFVTQSNNSLAFQLHNRGYDVWLGNNRGSFNSPEHMYLPKNSIEYWNYTLDDLGNYEIPAVIDFIAQKTGKGGEIIYVGHSQGTTIGMIYDLLHPVHAKNNLEGFIFLGPVAFSSDIPFKDAVFALVDLLASIKVTHLGSRNEFLTKVCSINEDSLKLCKFLFDLAYGKSNQYAPEQIPTLIRYSLMGESLKSLQQFVQIGRANKFQAFDYENCKNIAKICKSSKPREYKLSQINLPVYLFGAENDNLATTKVVERTQKELGSCCIQLYKSGDKKRKIYYNHMNFLYAKDNTQLFNNIFSAMDSLKNDVCKN